ncbi:MAG: GPI mannosyltransferase 1 [Watsoniomyces obsoletus]|nr:MAG: GPI mannosyltransferase 1 [Watsoniomyces obsoletus]
MDTKFRSTTFSIFSSAILLRAGFFFYGLFQDAHSPIKYTDIDYYVFTDASRFVSQGQSPYQRDTYRYTPILAYLLLPTTWSPTWFHFGKIIFSIGDIIAGWLIFRILRSSSSPEMTQEQALTYTSLWLLNPMVAAISTRGSSEGLLGVMIMGLLFACIQKRFLLAGMLLGLAVHFKIYPFIYGVSIIWWLDEERISSSKKTLPVSSSGLYGRISKFLNPARMKLGLTSLITFFGLNAMIYGYPFIQHTYLHHLTRLDHRHNFSVYNILLYLNSSPAIRGSSPWHLETLAFIPQLLLSGFFIPLMLAKRDLASTMLAQTFAFVAFNKVCTSQYFLWYIVLLPFYLPKSSFLLKPRLGIFAAGLWVLTQALWLHQGYQLEFLGKSTFVPGLWGSSILFFLTNVWILGVIVEDIRLEKKDGPVRESAKSKRE